MDFSHTGNIGDIIYSLPVLASIYKNTNTKCNLYLVPNISAKYYQGSIHPSGKVRLTEEGAKFLLPLIANQPYVNNVDISKEIIGVSLDQFRETPINLASGHIARWYFYTLSVNYNLANPWLWVDSPKSDRIVINRTFRYINSEINYAFMQEYDNVFFVGLEEEFIVTRKEIPNLKWIQAKDALELAQIINSAKFFVGNQSFPFSIAEALKVPRILEVCPWAPNVVVQGDDAWDFYFQEIFEIIFKKLNSK